MGRKKGKQGGEFGFKSKHAAFTSDIHQIVSEHRNSSRRKHASTAGNNNLSSQISFQSSFSSSRPRLSANVNQLRGLLRERIMEERLRDATHRRATRMSMPTNSQLRRTEDKTEMIDEKLSPSVPPGWLIEYDHREALAGISQHSQKNETSLSSLEILSIRSLAQVLNEYIFACGAKYVRERISTLTSHTITSLSALCTNVTDDTAYVLGGHAHVDCMVLNAPPRDLYQSDDIDDENNSKPGKVLTAKGLNAMILARSSSHNEPEETENEFSEHRVVVDSWEDIQFHDEFNHSDKFGMQRLELRNFDTGDTATFASFLCQCSMLTHLSLNKSLNAITGPQILLNSIDSEEGDNHDILENGSTKSLLDILPKLKILDLSGCLWLHLDLLKLFLKRVMIRRNNHQRSSYDERNSSVSLEMVYIQGCCEYLSKHCDALNNFTGRKPLICVHPIQIE